MTSTLEFIASLADVLEQENLMYKFADFTIGNLHWLAIGIFGTLYLFECINNRFFPEEKKEAEAVSSQDKSIDNTSGHQIKKRDPTLVMIQKYSRMILGNKITEFLIGILDYIIFKPNPLVQIFYLLIAVGGFYIYVTVAFVKFVPGPYCHWWHKITGSILMFICYYSFYMASVTDPGVIKTKQQVKQAKRLYKYDEVMYIKENECVTCKFEKPARSKHCSVCDVCVEKFDHHCIWINNCVGRRNYKWFLLFLFLHIIICFYGGIFGLLIFYGQMELKNMQGMEFINLETRERIKPTFWLHFKYFFLNEEKHFGIVVTICLVMAIVLVFFFRYHLNLARSNMTTNEEYKHAEMSHKFKWQIE